MSCWTFACVIRSLISRYVAVPLGIVELGVGDGAVLGLARPRRPNFLLVDRQVEADEQADVGHAAGRLRRDGVGLLHVHVGQPQRDVRIVSLAGQLDGPLVAGDGGQPALQLGAGGDGQAVEPLDLGRDGRRWAARASVRRSDSGLTWSCWARSARAVASPWLMPQQLPVELGDDDLGPEHVLLAGVAGGVAGLGDRDEINRQLAVLGQDLGGLFVEVEVVIRPLDGGDRVELGGGQLGQGDFDVLLGRLAAEAERAEPGELLGDAVRL